MGRGARMNISLTKKVIFSAFIFFFGSTASGQNRSAPPRKPLEGFRLRCCALLEPPILQVDPSNKPWGLSGLAATYLTELQKRSGFTCVSLEPWKPQLKNLSGFSGFLRHFDACVGKNGDSSECACDFGVGGISRTPERETQATFIVPFAFGSSSVAEKTGHIPNGRTKVFFLSPFDVYVWISVAGIIILHMIVTLFDRYFVPPMPSQRTPSDLPKAQRIRHVLLKTQLLRRIRYAFFGTLGSFVGGHWADMPPETSTTVPNQGEEQKTKGTTLESTRLAVNYWKPKQSARQRFLSLYGITVGLVLALVYEAALVVQIFESKPSSAFRTIEDLRNCRIDVSDMCLPKGGATEALYKKSIAPHRAIRGNCGKQSRKADEPKIVEGEDPYTLGMKYVASTEECNYFFGSTTLVEFFAAGEFCNRVSVVGESFSEKSSGFVAPNGANYTSVLNEITLELHEQNLLEDPVRHITRGRDCAPPQSNRVSLQQLGSFVILAYATLICLFIFVVCYPQEKKRNREAQVLNDSEERESPIQNNDSIWITVRRQRHLKLPLPLEMLYI